MFSECQTNTLRALVDCIIPADEYPSGWEAGTGEYLARLLTREPPLLFLYQTGLDSIDSEAPGFSLLPEDARNALLMQWEDDPAHAPFLRVLVAHVMESYYADPGNGGNRNAASWQMIGYKVTA